MTGNEAYVTLLVTDSYAPGALVLAQRLKELGTTRDIAVMVTANVSTSTRNDISLVFDRIIDIDKMDSGQADNLALLGRPELGVTFSKLQLWNLDYDKVVFLDADVLPLRLVDELFDRPEFSAAPDAGWPDCFNSGVFVAVPNKDTYKQLCDLAASKGSFDGGDQGLLNTYFSSWSTSSSEHRLPFIYNTTPTAVYRYVYFISYASQPTGSRLILLWEIVNASDGSETDKPIYFFSLAMCQLTV
ncbi:glycogenin 1, isoform CRA_c [Umbelopsis sp. PMI_123]|nr:glycogenin 1, isoform CRA_c [Umbelopsis sp. PMI_123]